MRILSSIPGRQLVAIAITTFVANALATSAFAGEPLFETRSYHPFTQIYGRPEFFAGSVLPRGTWSTELLAEITSHAEPASPGVEQLELDGETYRLAFTAKHAPTHRLEVGASIPLVGHSGGFLDGLVEWWHDALGLPNDSREIRPRDQLNFVYARDGSVEFELEDSGMGLGDVLLDARYRLLGDAPDARHLALHAGLKLPTGESDALRGSGAADYSVGVGLSDPRTLAGLGITLSAHAGMLFLGDGDVLAELQEHRVPFGGMQVGWRIGRRFDLLLQVQAAGRYYDSHLAKLGTESVQLSIGGNVRFPESGWNWTFGIVEDGLSDMMPDFALHTTVRRAI